MISGKRTILFSVLLISCLLAVNAQRRPVIGISDTHRDGTNATVPRSYVNAVLLTGGIPVVIPLMQDDNEMIELLNSLDGIIFTGGEDFDPAFYNERPIPQMGRVNAPRDKFDIKLLQLAAERSVPVLGICRGIQLINIAFGGSLYQDLPVQYYDKSIRHRQSQPSEEASHSVIVENFTVFSDIVKEQTLMVNSAHHQAIKDVAKGFRIAGKSSDKIVEVIEKIDNDNWILGVQFHPEMRVTRDVAMRRIFQRFIEEAGNQQKPIRPDRPLTASRPQIEREPLASAPEIIYKNVIDTQYIYKIVHDTLYVRVLAPVDTIYFPVYDTVYIAANTINTSPENVAIQVNSNISPDLAYSSDNTVNRTSESVTTQPETVTTTTKPVVNTSETVNIHYESANVSTNAVDATNLSANQANIPVNTVSLSANQATIPVDTVNLSANQTNNRSESDSEKSDSSVTDTALVSVQAIDISENKLNLFESDTLIFTPGVVPVATTAKKSAVSKSNKNEEKEKEKQAKREADEKNKQRQKEMTQKAMQNEKDKKEQAEKDKFEKKLAKAKEKQFQQQQKENAKIDKKELKMRKKQGTAEKE